LILRTHTFHALLAAILLATAACSKPMTVRIQESPELRFENGMRFLVWGKPTEAEREFTACLRLDPLHAKAFAAIGIIEAQNRHFLRARLSLSQAATLAGKPEETAFVQCAYIHLYIEQRTKDWLTQSEQAFETAVSHVPEFGDAHYFMGLAYRAAYRFREAEERFLTAARHTGYFSSLAAEHARRMGAIRRLELRTQVGKEAVLEDRISRARLASLLTHEMNLSNLLRDSERRRGLGASVTISDIKNRPEAEDIERIARWGIRGLCPYPDRTFRPDDTVTRAQLALILQSVVIQAVERPSLAYLFAEHEPRFPDVPKEDPSHNAVTLMALWGIMEAGIQGTGEFDPLGIPSGTETIRILRTLESKLETLGGSL